MILKSWNIPLSNLVRCTCCLVFIWLNNQKIQNPCSILQSSFTEASVRFLSKYEISCIMYADQHSSYNIWKYENIKMWKYKSVKIWKYEISCIMYVDQPSPGKNRIIGFPPILMKVIYHSRGFLITLIKLIKLLPKKDEMILNWRWTPSTTVEGQYLPIAGQLWSWIGVHYCWHKAN